VTFAKHVSHEDNLESWNELWWGFPTRLK